MRAWQKQMHRHFSVRYRSWLLNEARQRQLTGVDLKDESVPEVPALDASQSFLIGP